MDLLHQRACETPAVPLVGTTDHAREQRKRTAQIRTQLQTKTNLALVYAHGLGSMYSNMVLSKVHAATAINVCSLLL